MINSAIIFRLFVMNGALFDVLDYYLFAKSINKDIKLILIRSKNYMDEDQLYRHIMNRYNLQDGWKDGIIWLKKSYQLVSMKFKNIIVMDYFTTKILKYTNAEKFHLMYDHDKEYIEYYKSCIKDKRFEIYNEMPFGIGNIHYKLKIPVHLYKQPEKSKPNCYINCSGGKSLSELERAKKLTDKNLLVLSNVPDNFFELWDTYMYIHDGKYFEPRCRLLLEAKMFHKKIIYDNIYEIRDGSYYRWKEIKNLKKLPKQRVLTEEDKLIKIL